MKCHFYDKNDSNEGMIRWMIKTPFYDMITTFCDTCTSQGFRSRGDLTEDRSVACALKFALFLGFPNRLPSIDPCSGAAVYGVASDGPEAPRFHGEPDRINLLAHGATMMPGLDTSTNRLRRISLRRSLSRNSIPSGARSRTDLFGL